MVPTKRTTLTSSPFQLKFYYYEKHIYNVRDCCINHAAKVDKKSVYAKCFV